MQRLAAIAVALVAGVSAPMMLEAQTRTVNPQAPRVLVVVFNSRELPLGVQVADEVRERILRGISPRQITVIAKEQIVTFLEGSGYRADSALGLIDVEQLARALRADEVIGGWVTREGENVRIEPRVMLARDVNIGQPLPVQTTNNLGNAARAIERAYEDARRQFDDNQACENGIRDGNYDAAVAAARKAIERYPEAVIARLCMASAYQAQMGKQEGAAAQASADSILRITSEVRRMDPRSTIALRLAYAAHKAKGDDESAVRALVALLEIERNNYTLQQQVVEELARLGRPEVALPIVDTLIARNPGDPQMLRQRWLLLLNAAAQDTVPSQKAMYFEQALAAGRTMVQSDTSMADTSYFERQLAAASAVPEKPQLAVEVASRATQKFPNRATFWAIKAQSERRAGQLQMAEQSIRRALAIDPATQNGNLLLGTIMIEQGQLDSAMALARRAAAAGESATTWGQFLLAPTSAAWRRADSVKTVPEYRRALGVAQLSDSLAPSVQAKFFAGVASFYVAANVLQEAQAAKSCPLARQAQDMLLITQMNMPAAGSVDARTAQTILGLVSQYSPAADQMVKAWCK